MRYQEKNVCKECHEYGIECSNSLKCKPIRDHDFRDYGGIRFTADGFDCALPLTIDSHSVCAYECLYCFADNLQGHQEEWKRQVGETSLKTIDGIFSGKAQNKMAKAMRKALKYDNRNANGYPCPVQLGGLCDPCDSIEQNSGWLLDFMDIAIKHRQPVRMSTKGAIFLLPEYREKIAEAPELFWVAYSIITPDDALLRKVDRYAPDATTRLRCMKQISELGVNTSLRLRPIIRGISDRGGGWRELIAKSASAGAKAVSAEVMFYPMGIPKDKQDKMQELSAIAGIDFHAQYSSFGHLQACTRPAYTWTESVMHDIRDCTHENGMVLGVSDPVWKQLSDTGCCCGILPDHPVFGNWERESATEAVVQCVHGNKKLIKLEDIVPPWAADVPLANMVHLGVGAQTVHEKKYATWADHLERTWNNPSKERSPMNYFQGAVRIAGQDENGNLVYEYRGLDRKHMKTGWNGVQ